MFRSCLLLALLTAPAMAAEVDAPRALPRGLFLDDTWRYEPPRSVWQWARGLVGRVAADFISIPSNTDSWDAADVITLMLTTAVSIGATVPVDGRSLDARILDESHRLRGANCDYAVRNSVLCRPPTPSGFHVWNQVNNVIIISTALTVPLALLLGGVIGDKPELVEAGTLAIEAFAVAQIYHVSLKLFVGREGPLGGDGAGLVHGPSGAYYPDGWPSGHAATLFSIAAVYATYFEHAWLRVALLGTAGFLATMLVVDDAHFASDVVLGATMGYLTGRWVVHHRSSRFTSRSGLPIRLTTLAPMSIDHGVGVAARFAF